MNELIKKVPQKCLNLMERIASRGGQVFLVGGCVRDLLLKQSSKDWDLVTNLGYLELYKLFPEGHYHGKSFSIFTVDGIEIATFRGQSSQRTSLEDDLRHRDFTINSMAIDINGKLWDFFSGQKDLQNRVVRFVANPYDRVQEDYCRMLRGCRFVGYLSGQLDQESAQAIVHYSDAVQIVAKERLRRELLKMMELSDLESAVICMQRTNILKWILPSLNESQNRTVPIHGENKDLFIHCLNTARAIAQQKPLLRLAALLHASPHDSFTSSGNESDERQKHVEMVRELLTRLRFSYEEIYYVAEAIEKLALSLYGLSTFVDLRRFLSKLGVPLQDFLDLYHAHLLASDATEAESMAYDRMTLDLIKIKQENSAFSLKDLKINGHVLKKMGIKAGPVFSKILDACLEEVLQEPSKNEEHYLINYARKFYSQQRALKKSTKV
jgi:tRNA nucleotidyltransferase (CCA-adding enzyme)